jgi:type I restriction enzyme M protein
MVVLRRLDTVLEPTKEAVMEVLTFQKNEADFSFKDRRSGICNALREMLTKIDSLPLKREGFEMSWKI